jgi:hypothetical protein
VRTLRFETEKVVEGRYAVHLARRQMQRFCDEVQSNFVQIAERFLDLVQGFDQRMALVTQPTHFGVDDLPSFVVCWQKRFGEFHSSSLFSVAGRNFYGFVGTLEMPNVPIFSIIGQILTFFGSHRQFALISIGAYASRVYLFAR